MTSASQVLASAQYGGMQTSELLSYIAYLEAKVEFLEKHHEHCNISTSLDASTSDGPYVRPESVVDPEITHTTATPLPLPQSHLYSIDTSTSHNSRHRIPSATGRIAYSSAKQVPRWRRIVDQMLDGWEEPYSWIDKRKSIGLETTDQNVHALSLLLGLKNDKPIYDDCCHGLSEASEEHAACTNKLIKSARQYALDTKDTDTSTVFGKRIRMFRELIFSSLCALLEYKQLPVDTINDLMRICISSSGPANLYRLRRGALWVNRIIACMFAMGWNRQATEFFLLSGRPVSQYGLLCEARVHSMPYFRNRFVEVKDIVETPNDDICWIPFSIPLIIKGVVGDELNLEEICTALNYDVNML